MSKEKNNESREYPALFETLTVSQEKVFCALAQLFSCFGLTSHSDLYGYCDRN